MRTVIIYFSDAALLDLNASIGLVIANVPACTLESVLPLMGAAQMRVPDESLYALGVYLSDEMLGTYEIDEGHRLTGA